METLEGQQCMGRVCRPELVWRLCQCSKRRKINPYSKSSWDRCRDRFRTSDQRPKTQIQIPCRFQGNHVTNKKWEWAMFQDLGSSPASMQAGKNVDCDDCFPEHVCQQSDAEQAHAQALLRGTDTWVALPREAWPAEWFDKKNGNPLYDQPVVRLLRPLSGHPDAGTYWERHCDKAVKSIGCEPVAYWPYCDAHKEWKLLLSACVDDFKMSSPEKSMATAWSKLREQIEMGDPVPAGLYLGCKHNYNTEKDVKSVIYDMKHYLMTTVEAYQKICETASGNRAALKKCCHSVRGGRSTSGPRQSTMRPRARSTVRVVWTHLPGR